MLKSFLRAVKEVLGGNAKRPSARSVRRVHLCLEQLEERDCPAVAGYVVTSLADAGNGVGLAGDLRYCITQANGRIGQDTISFQNGLTGTITLGSALPEIVSPLILNGPGAGVITIQRDTAEGTPQFGLMTVSDTTTISGLTFENGDTNGNGGAISNASTLGVDDCVFHNNTAVAGGGAISNTAHGSLSVNGCSFTFNTALGGGAIASDSDDTVEIIDSQLSYNTANWGGAVAILHGDLTIKQGTSITYNTAEGLNLGGGGILVGEDARVAILGGSSISYNGAATGAGIFVQQGGFLEVDDAMITYNQASDEGGGVYLDGSSSALFYSNAVIAYNTATNGGDGISYDGDLTSLYNDATMIDDTADPR